MQIDTPERVAALTTAANEYGTARRTYLSSIQRAAISEFRTQDHVLYTHRLTAQQVSIARALAKLRASCMVILGATGQFEAVGASGAYNPPKCFLVSLKHGMLRDEMLIGTVDRSDAAIDDKYASLPRYSGRSGSCLEKKVVTVESQLTAARLAFDNARAARDAATADRKSAEMKKLRSIARAAALTVQRKIKQLDYARMNAGIARGETNTDALAAAWDAQDTAAAAATAAWADEEQSCVPA